MKKDIYFLFLLMLLFSCQPREKTALKEKDIQEQTQTQEPPVGQSLVALPEDIFKQVYLEADYLDVIFESLPFSMSQNSNASIRQILNHVDNKVPGSISDNCPLFGQQLYQKNGEIILEADFYHSPGCYYYVFKYKGEKYFNGMTESGITFYDNLKKRSF